MVNATDQRSAPAATGTIASRPLVHLLVYARNRRLTGRLELRSPEGTGGVIHLWRGRITSAETVPPVAYFGAVAYELGLIDTPTLDSTLLEIAKTKRLHGEVLIERRALTPTQRDDVLAEQAFRKIHTLFALSPESTFAFYAAVPSVEEPPITFDPIAPAWRGLRDHAPMESVREVLARYTTTTFRMANEGPVLSACFNPEERAVCDALTWKPMTIAQIRAMNELPPARADLLVYLLVITKCIEPSTESASKMAAATIDAPVSSVPSASTVRPNGPTSAPMPFAPSSRPADITTTGVRASSPTSTIPSAPAGPRSSIPDGQTRIATPGTPMTISGEMRRTSLSFRVPTSPPGMPTSKSSPPKSGPQSAPLFGPADLGAVGVAHRARTVDTEDYFAVLGLRDGASPEAARASFFHLARLWHPDRLPPDLAPFRGEVEKIFAHMTLAHATLTDVAARRAYLAKREEGGGAISVANKPRAEVIRDIETALGKREFELAEQMSLRLVQADKDDAEAQALVAWASALGGEASEEALRVALPALDRAVKNDAYCDRAYFYRGIVHKRLKNSAAAFRDFARTVQLNPKHVDAQREIRIFEMRARKGSGEHALEALIAKKKNKK